MKMKIKMKNTPKNNEELASTVANTLDKSLVEIDDLSLQRLKNARVDALAHTTFHSTKSVYFSSELIRFGIAASLTCWLLFQ